MNEKLWISDNASCYIEDMMLMAQSVKAHKGIKCIIVDHIGKIKTREKGLNREQQVALFSSSLKEMARRCDCPVIAVCQLNRSVEVTDDKRPTLSTLRDSGRIEEDADSVVFLYRAEYYKKIKNMEVLPDEVGVMEASIAKQRNRDTCTLISNFDRETMRFSAWGRAATRIRKNTIPQRLPISSTQTSWHERVDNDNIFGGG
jgi:replicative DNA helicase